MDCELDSSELGTQEYWNERYKEETINFKDHGDVGEIWFGEDIVDRLIKWMNKNVDNKDSIIVDVGCGNGMLLIELSKEEFSNLRGIDYSPEAIHLAKEIAKRMNYNIHYDVMNLIDLPNSCSLSNVDIVLDKGTYDAISLSTDSASNRLSYIKNMYAMLQPNGKLVLTSCNWTSEELQEQFQSYFSQYDIIPTPQFKFAGKVGNIVSCIVFEKKK